VPAAGQKPHARAITSRQHAEGVQLNFVKPAVANWPVSGWAGEARFDEASGAGTHTPHWSITTSGPGRVESDLSMNPGPTSRFKKFAHLGHIRSRHSCVDRPWARAVELFLPFIIFALRPYFSMTLRML
jgi:hypothetical protein